MENNRRMARIVFFFMVVTLVIASFSLSAYANPQPEKVGNLGWIHWDSGIVKAVGTAPSREAAIKQAYSNLGGIVEKVHVNPQTTVKDLAAADNSVSGKVAEFVKNAPVSDEKKQADGIYRIVVVANLHGDKGLLTLLNSKNSSTSLPKDNQVPGYSGLVVDVTGLGLERTSAPKIYDETGREIFGTVKMEASYIEEQGIVSYAFNPEALQLVDEGKSRAGANPLTIKAIGVKDHNFNVIISQADGDKILEANKGTDFLGKCAVVIKKQ